MNSQNPDELLKIKKEFIEKFKKEVEKADWAALETHHEREAVFLVAGSLDLYEVASAIALDEVALVKTWMDQENLRRPTEKEVEFWKKESLEQERPWLLGRILILSPYVLLQLGE